MKWIEDGDDIPTTDDDSDREVEPHRPHEHCVDDVWHPTDEEYRVDEREFDLEHVENLPLVVSELPVALDELLVHLLAALEVQNRICNHHNENRPVVENVTRHDAQKCRPQAVNVMAAGKKRKINRSALAVV